MDDRRSAPRRRVRAGVLGTALVALALVAAACGNNDNSSSAGSSSGGEKEGGKVTIAGQSANNHGTEDVSGSSTVKLEQDDFYFDPTILKGTPGQAVTLHIENEGSTTHNFSITDQNVDVDVDAGKDADVKVKFPQSGTLVFFCKFHQSMGMLGGLQVSS